MTELLLSLGWQRLALGLRAPVFWICAFYGLIGLALPGKALPATGGAISWFVCAPLVEELSWRAILQNELERFLPGGSPISRANLAVSALFALCHVIMAPAIMSALVFFPSLIFGLIWTKFHSTWLCALLHLWYNLALRL